MERNTPTTIDKLQTGDRFYFPSDKKREVWQVVPEKTKVTKWQTYKYFAVKDGTKFPNAVSKTTVLIFLRHSNQ